MTGPRNMITEWIEPELAPLLPRFLANCKSEADQINAALTAGDWETVSRLGHAIKGAGGWYGFSGMARIGHRLQQAGTEMDAQAVATHLAALRDYLEGVRVGYAFEPGD